MKICNVDLCPAVSVSTIGLPYDLLTKSMPKSNRQEEKFSEDRKT